MLVSLALCCCWCAAVASLICSPRLLARCCFSLSLSLSSAQLLPPVCCSEPPPQPQLPPSPAATPPPLKASLQSDRTRTQQSTAGMQARGGARARARREGEREAAADSVSSRCPSAAASLTRLHPPLHSCQQRLFSSPSFELCSESTADHCLLSTLDCCCRACRSLLSVAASAAVAATQLHTLHSPLIL